MQIETILHVGLKFQLRRSRLFLERNNRHKIKKKSRIKKEKKKKDGIEREQKQYGVKIQSHSRCAVHGKTGQKVNTLDWINMTMKL